MWQSIAEEELAVIVVVEIVEVAMLEELVNLTMVVVTFGKAGL